MPIWRIPVSREPILLLDPDLNGADELATHLELKGFPTRIERTGAGAQAAMINSEQRATIRFIGFLRQLRTHTI